MHPAFRVELPNQSRSIFLKRRDPFERSRKTPAHWTRTPAKNLCVDEKRVKPQRNGPNQSVKEKMKKKEEGRSLDWHLEVKPQKHHAIKASSQSLPIYYSLSLSTAPKLTPGAPISIHTTPAPPPPARRSSSPDLRPVSGAPGPPQWRSRSTSCKHQRLPFNFLGLLGCFLLPWFPSSAPWNFSLFLIEKSIPISDF